MKRVTVVAAIVAALVFSACGSSNDNSTSSGSSSSSASSGGNTIKSNPANSGKNVTIGSKNFTEEFILGEIYAQALQAAGYDVKKQLNLGDSNIAIKALKDGEISGYPDYTAQVLEQFFSLGLNQIPSGAQAEYQKAKSEFEKQGLTAFPPTPFADANALGTLKST